MSYMKIDCIFTIDYEIYGNGEGSLQDLVFEPARELLRIFQKHEAKLVFFVEVSELEMIERAGADEAVGRVKQQVRECYHSGHEVALHLHPQWYNARRESGRWVLDYQEYNLCTLPRERIDEIVTRGIDYLRNAVGDNTFGPVSFRAGNWLFQPTATAANVLAAHGIKIDSSVFKGGLQHKQSLDYRRARRNGDYWLFGDDVNVPDPAGAMFEIPIHTEMVPFWRMVTKKRVGLQKKGYSAGQSGKARFARMRDFARLLHPLKFDFCRMTFDELVGMTERVIAQHRRSNTYKPMVAIGHTKDLVDFDTVEKFLSYLSEKDVSVNTLEGAYQRCQPVSSPLGIA